MEKEMETKQEVVTVESLQVEIEKLQKELKSSKDCEKYWRESFYKDEDKIREYQKIIASFVKLLD